MGPHVAERLSAYMDDELDAPERDAVASHLRGCPSCARHLEDLRAVDKAARELPLAVPDGYFDAFRGNLRQRLQRGRPAPRRLAPAWALAAAAIVLAVLTPRLLREPRPRVPPAAPAPAAAPSETDSPLADTATPAPRPEAPAPRAAGQRRLAERARPQAPPPPAATAEPAREYARNDTGAPSAGYAAPPAEVDEIQGAPLQGAPQAKKMEAESGAARRGEESKERRDKTALGALQDRAAPGPTSEDRFQLLLGRTPSSAAEARALREAWRAYAREAGTGPRADEARVRAVEAGVEAWRRGKDEGDRARARRDGREYLERPDALQRDRVQGVLQSLSP